MADQYKDYNGQKVLTGNGFSDTINEGVASWNTATGQNLSAEEYDRKLNPTTAGARYGDNDPNPAPASTAAPGGLLYSGANTPTAATYTPTMQSVGEKSTVQNQLANITANGSALNTQAETAAKKAMSGRGLLNSSIAVGAGQEAVLKSALPIAQQDASTYAQTDAANAGYANSADQFNAGQKNQLTGQLIGSDTSLAVADKNIASQQLISDRDNATKLQLQQLDADTRKSLASLDEATKVKLQGLESADKQLLQTNISAANMYAQLAQALSQISTSTSMDAAGKQQATDNQINLFRQQLQAVGQVSGLDLSKYFQQIQSNTSSQTDPALTGQQAARDAVGKVVG